MRDPLPAPWVRMEAIRGDASSRSYARLWSADGKSAIAVDYASGEKRFLARDLEVRSWCAAHELTVPALLTSDISAGWAIVEDFGPSDAERTIAQGSIDRRLELARSAIQPMSILAVLDPTDLPPWNAPLDGRRMRWELAGFELWVLRHRVGRGPSTEIGRWLDELAAIIDDHPKRVCHRDYHLNNLYFLGNGQVGLIDFQDILVGPDTYDAVSLLCERGMPHFLGEKDRTELKEFWAELTGAAPRWRDRWRWVRIQRGLKALGTFARLAASGTTDYEPWLKELAHELAPDLAAVEAPSELVHLLLDL